MEKLISFHLRVTTIPDKSYCTRVDVYLLKKNAKEKLSPQQEAVKRQFKKMGFEIYKVDQLEIVYKFVNEVLLNEIHTT